MEETEVKGAEEEEEEEEEEENVSSIFACIESLLDEDESDQPEKEEVATVIAAQTTKDGRGEEPEGRPSPLEADFVLPEGKGSGRQGLLQQAQGAVY